MSNVEQIREKVEDEPVTPRTVKRFISPTGETFPEGDQVYNRPEPNGELEGNNWWGEDTTIGVADKMLLYPIIATVMQSIKLPISQAEFTFEPTDEKIPLAVEIAETLQKHFEKDSLLSSSLISFLQNLEFGFMPHYVVWGDRAGLLAPIEYEPIIPRWHQSLTFSENTGRPETLNILNSRGERAELPFRFLFWLRHKAIGVSNFYGIPFMRPMHSPWNRVIHLLNWEMIQAEHLSGGLYAGKPPADKKQNKGDAEAVLAVLERIRVGESSAIVPPPGWTIEALTVASAIYDLDPAIKRANEQLFMTGFGQVMLIGMNSEGARASSETHLKMHFNGIRGIASEFAVQFTRQQSHKIVRQNWGEAAANNLTPKLLIEGLTPDNVVERSSAMVEAVTGGVLSADDVIENTYRTMWNIPKLIGPSSRKPLTTAPAVLSDTGIPISEAIEESRHITMCECGCDDNYLFSEMGDEIDGSAIAQKSLANLFENYKPKKLKREPQGVERHCNLMLTDLVLDTHRITGRDMVMSIIRPGIKNRARSLQAALNGDISKVGIIFPKTKAVDVGRAINKMTKLALGFGFNEAEREIKLQEQGKDAPQELAKERQDELAIQASEAIEPDNTVQFTLPIDRRTAAARRLSEQMAAQLILALEVEYSAVFLAMQRSGKVFTLEEITETLARRESVITNAVLAEAGAVAFATGRSEFFLKFGEEKPRAIKEWLRSELLDSNTCGPCEDIDGTVTDEKLTENGVYPFCDSTKGAGNACRGMDFAILRDEFIR